MLNRREMLLSLAGLGLLPLACSPEPRKKRLERLWFAAAGLDGPTHGIGFAGPEHRSEVVVTGFRGHDVTQDPTRLSRFVLSARRPGKRSVAVDLAHPGQLQEIPVEPGFVFQGHGVFNHDASRLYTTEADAETAEGSIGVRDGHSFKMLARYPTGGLGPHELLLMPDGRSLAVANGGLLKRGEPSLVVYNLDTMDASLSFISLENGQILSQHRVDEPKASIRHIDVTQDGTVAIGLQMQRKAAGHDHITPLCGWLRPGAPKIELFPVPEAYTELLRDYVGSVAITPDGHYAAFTSPVGGICLVWNTQTQKPSGAHAMTDVCGLAVQDDGFIVSSSTGVVRLLDFNQPKKALREWVFDHMQWDNHLISVQTWRTS